MTVLSITALDTDAEVRGVQRWMALDLWMATGGDSMQFEEHIEQHGWSTTWSMLLSVVRDRFA